MGAAVIYNAAGITSIVPQVAGNPGILLNESGSIASADISIEAHYMALEAFTAGVAVPVCLSGVLYDPDAPFSGGNKLYLGLDGGLIDTNLRYGFVQYVGRSTNTYTAWFDLTPVDPAIEELRAAVGMLLDLEMGLTLTEFLDDYRRQAAVR